MFILANPNPNGLYVEDCVVRAISIATDRDWDTTYIYICLQGFINKNMPSVGAVWRTYLKSLGFRNWFIPDTCPDCYTIRDFCYDFPFGTFVIATGSHVVCVIDGDYYDAWDSGDEVPVEVWQRIGD